MTRRRLDAELVRRGLCSGRAVAREVVESGAVRVGGAVVTKPASMVAEDVPIVLLERSIRYASRAGGKLAAALDRFSVDPAGLRCLDAGASTGGFTDVLLRRGAAHVDAIDVGYGQLAWALRTDPRVTLRERTNIREVAPETLTPADLVVADLSFISLRTVLPDLRALAREEALFVLLVKPQFEVGRADVGKGGVVRDPSAWRRVLDEVVAAAAGLGLGARGAMASPLPGPAGNIEFLLRLGPGAQGGADLDAAIVEAEGLGS